MLKLLQFYLGVLFRNRNLKTEKEKKKGAAGLAGPRPAHGRVVRVASRPVTRARLGRGRAQAGAHGWPPGLPRCRAGPRPVARPGCLDRSVRSLLLQAGPWPGRLAAFFPLFVHVFLLQRLLFGATYKRGFLPIFLRDLISCSLSSIANILRARFLLIPPMILAQI